MIIKNNLGLEVSIENSDMAYVVSKYQKPFDDISNLESFEQETKRTAKNMAVAALLVGGVLYGVSKYVGKLREEATQEVLREIYKDERATNVFKEMFYGGK
jgi:hypothetical protein